MGTTIGDNCIIGAGALVKGSFPNNVVIAGNPARIICSLEDYYKRIKSKSVNEAIACVRHFFNENGTTPTIKMMGNGHAWLYLPHTEDTINKYPEFFCLTGVDNESIKSAFLNSKPLFESFDDFTKYALSHSEWEGN